MNAVNNIYTIDAMENFVYKANYAANDRKEVYRIDVEAANDRKEVYRIDVEAANDRKEVYRLDVEASDDNQQEKPFKVNIQSKFNEYN